MSLANLFRRLGVIGMWLTSAYVVLTLLIALTEEGRPTSAVFSTNLGELFYPEWYANPLVITAVKIAVLTYPAAALAYGIATLLSYARGEKPAPMAVRSQPAALSFAGLANAAPKPAFWPMESAFSETTAQPAAPRPPAEQPENPEYLCILDMAFFIRAISRNAASVLGLPPHALQRRPFTNFVLPADVSQLHSAWDRLLSDPQAVIALHLRLRHADDVTVEADAICRAGLGADGRIISMTLMPRAEQGPIDDRLAAALN
ncbi:PAS domain-containing protein [Acidisoma cellulosilytica]|uniref:PAS domain-containing protein n=1 Tax=Acidisoma cellulosilyticum TaxID=2802395 RepID=A0A963Z1L9_9PROT|nr:PAS domain-containing protein [Acidisoma cellulosilyticum]MCB8880205.1 PAS domain-containing protein [Acidisoma cellulosilyticum]